jgi:hypothetical protein
MSAQQSAPLVGWPGNCPLTAHAIPVTSLADLAALRHHPMQDGLLGEGQTLFPVIPSRPKED